MWTDKDEKMDHARFRFFQSRLLETSFFLALLVVLFLLLSFVLQMTGNIPLANFIGSINAVLSWPSVMIENIMDYNLHWIATALCILLFWFTIFYLIFIFLSFVRFSGNERKSTWKYHG